MLGSNNPFYHKKHTPESILKISMAGKGRYVSQETRKKRSKSLKGKKRSNITKMRISLSKSYPVIQLTLNGKKIKTYKSMKEAEDITKVNKSNICYCCKGLRETAGGYKWNYLLSSN